MIKFQIITNNPKVKRQCRTNCKIVLKDDVPCLKIFTAVRDMIQQGYILLSNPLMETIAPTASPYRSILVSLEPETEVDPESERIIKECLLGSNSFLAFRGFPWSPHSLLHFQRADCEMLNTAMERVKNEMRENKKLL